MGRTRSLHLSSSGVGESCVCVCVCICICITATGADGVTVKVYTQTAIISYIIAIPKPSELSRIIRFSLPIIFIPFEIPIRFAGTTRRLEEIRACRNTSVHVWWRYWCGRVIGEMRVFHVTVEFRM
jgi:hypothetical protein